MNTQPIDTAERIKALAAQAAQGSGMYIVDVEVKGSGQQPQVWVYIDAEEGRAGIDDCTRISRELQVLVDAHELYGDANYTLNVSTPGLSRPLKDVRQYRNNIGRRAKVKVRRDGVKTEVYEGTLSDVADASITVETAKGPNVLPFDEIIETKILPAW